MCVHVPLKQAANKLQCAVTHAHMHTRRSSPAPPPLRLMQGYIYVEAHKEASVKEALRGLRMIFGSKPPQLVPLREMVDAIRVPRTTAKAIGESTGCNKHATGSCGGLGASWGTAGWLRRSALAAAVLGSFFRTGNWAHLLLALPRGRAPPRCPRCHPYSTTPAATSICSDGTRCGLACCCPTRSLVSLCRARQLGAHQEWAVQGGPCQGGGHRHVDTGEA